MKYDMSLPKKDNEAPTQSVKQLLAEFQNKLDDDKLFRKPPPPPAHRRAPAPPPANRKPLVSPHSPSEFVKTSNNFERSTSDNGFARRSAGPKPKLAPKPLHLNGLVGSSSASEITFMEDSNTESVHTPTILVSPALERTIPTPSNDDENEDGEEENVNGVKNRAKYLEKIGFVPRVNLPARIDRPVSEISTLSQVSDDFDDGDTTASEDESTYGTPSVENSRELRRHRHEDDFDDYPLPRHERKNTVCTNTHSEIMHEMERMGIVKVTATAKKKNQEQQSLTTRRKSNIDGSDIPEDIGKLRDNRKGRHNSLFVSSTSGLSSASDDSPNLLSNRSSTFTTISGNGTEMIVPDYYTNDPEENKRLKKLHYAAMEFLKVQSNYVQYLTEMAVLYPEYMERYGKRIGKDLLAAHNGMENVVLQIKKVLLQILPSHDMLLNEINNVVSEWDSEHPCMSKPINMYADFLKCCQPFLDHKTEFLNHLLALRNENKEFDEATYMFETEVFKRGKKGAVIQQLDQVHQNFMRYKLLMLRYSEYLVEDSDEKRKAMETIQKLENVTQTVNQKMGLPTTEELTRLYYRYQCQFDVLAPGRTLIRQGDVMKQTRKELQPRYLVLYVNSVFNNDTKPDLSRENIKIGNHIVQLIRMAEDSHCSLDVEEEDEMSLEEDELASDDFDWDPTSEFCQQLSTSFDKSHPNKVRFGDQLVDVKDVERAVEAFQVTDIDRNACNRGKRRPSLTTMNKRFSFISNDNHLKKLRKIAKEGKIKVDSCAAIQFVSKLLAEEAQEAFRNGFIIHDDDLREMAAAIMKKNGVKVNFKISHSWLNNFKRANRISSRHITKFVSRSRFVDEAQLEKNSIAFVELARTRMANYTLDEVVNCDQSGFLLELHTNRTLAPTGSKKVEAVVHSVSATTHSFTMLPILTASGKLFPILYILMKEPNGKFPARGHFQPTNLHIEASTSHIMGNKHMVSFVGNVVLHPTMPDRVLMLVDSWIPWKNRAAMDAVTPPHKQLETLIIPPGCTGMIQPLDIGLFGNYKKIVKKITRHAQRIAPEFIPHRRDSVFKFSDCVWLCRVSTSRTSYNQFEMNRSYRIPLDGMRCDPSDNDEYTNVLNIRSKVKSVTLHFSSEKECNQWFDDIRKASNDRKLYRRRQSEAMIKETENKKKLDRLKEEKKKNQIDEEEEEIEIDGTIERPCMLGTDDNNSRSTSSECGEGFSSVPDTPIDDGSDKFGSPTATTSGFTPVGIKKTSEVQPVWLPDNSSTECLMEGCSTEFSIINRRHHCRDCGWLMCRDCKGQAPLSKSDYKKENVCPECYEKIHNLYIDGVLFPTNRLQTMSDGSYLVKVGPRDDVDTVEPRKLFKPPTNYRLRKKNIEGKRRIALVIGKVYLRNRKSEVVRYALLRKEDLRLIFYKAELDTKSVFEVLIYGYVYRETQLEGKNGCLFELVHRNQIRTDDTKDSVIAFRVDNVITARKWSNAFQENLVEDTTQKLSPSS